MSKVNRRKEIKEKEDFQIKFQLALSANNNNVLQWLPKAKDELSNISENLEEDKDSFLDLPVIPNGAGLSALDKEDFKNDSHTIGSFLNADNVPKSQPSNTSREARTGSKAMSALMNKMRSDTRNNISNKYQISKDQGSRFPRSKILEDVKKQKLASKQKAAPDASELDSDDEDSKSRQISGKRIKMPHFGKKGKGRPF
ncbi:hypothetical protein OY671_000545 [Metschnikowia pulcherrima]|nr:hypothetical protein OY671_000545 [Metschnikowia pulcherrima]